VGSGSGSILVKKVKRTGTPIVVGHRLVSVNGNDVAAKKWKLADVFAELKTSGMPIKMVFHK